MYNRTISILKLSLCNGVAVVCVSPCTRILEIKFATKAQTFHLMYFAALCAFGAVMLCSTHEQHGSIEHQMHQQVERFIRKSVAFLLAHFICRMCKGTYNFYSIHRQFAMCII